MLSINCHFSRDSALLSISSSTLKVLLRYLDKKADESQIYCKTKLSDAASIIVLDMFIKLCLFIVRWTNIMMFMSEKSCGKYAINLF